MRSLKVQPRLFHTRFRSFSTRIVLAAQRGSSRPPWQYDQGGTIPGFARNRLVPIEKPSSASAPEPQSTKAPSPNLAVSQALQNDGEDANCLSAPVHIPEDPHSILDSDHPSISILANSSIVIQRQLEMMNVFLGFEQANRYVIMDSHGSHIGYLAEQDHGLGNAMARQAFRTHRSFTTHVFDKDEKEVLRFHRPFAWISSRIQVYDAFSRGRTSASTALQGTSVQATTGVSNAHISLVPLSDMRMIGEAQQQWAPLRRKYNLFLYRDSSTLPTKEEPALLTTGGLPLSDSKELQLSKEKKHSLGLSQFAYVDEPFLSWDFSLLSEDQELIGSVNRNFVGLARELFTDTGVYALRMDSAAHSSTSSEPSNVHRGPREGMTLDQRAVMLATAVSIDFDYFSRHSHAGAGGLWPMWIPWGGTGAGAGAGEGVGAEAQAAGGSAEAGAGPAREGAVAGAGTMAGYEMMQRAREQRQQDEASPQNMEPDGTFQPAPDESMQNSWPTPPSDEQSDDVWGGWRDQQNDSGEQTGGNGGGEGGSFFDDLF